MGPVAQPRLHVDAAPQLSTLEQPTSQSHDSLQSTSPQPKPVQLTSQRPAPHSTAVHGRLFALLLPLHVTVHAAASPQSTVPQAPIPEQVIVQSYPDGQLTEPHESFEVHAIVQVFAATSQLSHSPGQSSGRQYPTVSSQTRAGSAKPAQSASVEQLSSPVRVSTQQELAPATRRAVNARTISAVLTTSRRS